jgi:NAD(P)-dependent dehydrogenase (short-subunit alcohol dehydrogenase family)
VRAALITGGSSGIGLAIARTLVADGYGITLVARRPDGLEVVAGELRADGGEVETVAVNLVEDDAAERAIAAHRRRFGGLDVLVNSAGVGIGAPVDQITAKQVDLQTAVNLRSLILFYREAVDLLEQAERPLVVNLASVAGRSGQPWLSVYSAVKAAVIAFTEAMNKELAPRGIKSCAICPGTVDTPMTGYLEGERDWMLDTRDISEAVRFLLRLSPRCIVPELVLDNLTRP